MTDFPKINLRKDRNLAFVYVGKKKVYLGKFSDTDTVKFEYFKLFGCFPPGFGYEAPTPLTVAIQSRENLIDVKPIKMEGDSASMRPVQSVSLDCLFNSYIDFNQSLPKPVLQEINRAKLIRNKLNLYFSGMNAGDFGPVELRTLRDRFQADGYYDQKNQHKEYSRQYLNTITKTVKRIFAWGVGEGLVEQSDHQALTYCRPLLKGRTEAPEAIKRDVANLDDVEATLPYLQPTYADIIRLLITTGARPSEILNLKWEDIEQVNDGVWIFAPEEHKTKIKGKDRFIGLGVGEMDILKNYMDEEGYIFNPASILKERWAIQKAHRTVPLYQSHQKRNENKNTGTRLSKCAEKVDVHLLDRAVRKACQKAIEEGVITETWTPYQLRHSAITRTREEEGAESAQHYAGHSQLSTQSRYDHSAKDMVVKLTMKRNRV